MVFVVDSMLNIDILLGVLDLGIDANRKKICTKNSTPGPKNLHRILNPLPLGAYVRIYVCMCMWDGFLFEEYCGRSGDPSQLTSDWKILITKIQFWNTYYRRNSFSTIDSAIKHH